MRELYATMPLRFWIEKTYIKDWFDLLPVSIPIEMSIRLLETIIPEIFLSVELSGENLCRWFLLSGISFLLSIFSFCIRFSGHLGVFN